MRKLTVITITYKEQAHIKRFLDNILSIKEKMSDLEIILRDHSSNDGTHEILNQYRDKVRILETDNVGLSAGFNDTLKLVDSEYVLFIGSDAYPDLETLKGLCDYFDSNPKVSAATTKLVLADGSLDMDAHRAFPTPWNSLTRLTGLYKIKPKSNFFNGYFMPESDLNTPHEIDLCISHFMFCVKSEIDRIGGFDEDYFLYGEDFDFCYRLKESGGIIMYLPQWKTLHLKGGSVGIRKTTRNIDKKPLAHRLRSQKLSAIAMEIFVRKNYMKKYPAILCYGMIYSSRLLGFVRVMLESFR